MAKIVSFVVAATCLALAGCGGDEPVEAAPAAPTERSVFVSAVDCENSGKYAIEDCSKAIERAVRSHDKYSPTYKSLNSCESAEGAGKCERVGDRAFRPRLAAYVFDTASPPVARPLYLTTDGAAGFRTAEKEVLMGTDDSLIFSKSAHDLYDLHATK